MMTRLLIVGDTVFQRIVDLHVCIERSFTRESPYVGYLCFTKLWQKPKGVFDRHGALLPSARMDDLRFPVAEYERVRPRITRVYEQVFSDLVVHDELAFPYDSEWELVKKTARAVLAKTASDIGSIDIAMMESWLNLRDVVERLDRERVPNEVILSVLERLAKACGHGWVGRTVAACRASLAVYRATNAVRDKAA
jgi:hypothetical protein